MAQDVLRVDGWETGAFKPINGTFDGEESALQRIKLSAIAQHVADGSGLIVRRKRHQAELRGVDSARREGQGARVGAGERLLLILTEARGRNCCGPDRLLGGLGTKECT